MRVIWSLLGLAATAAIPLGSAQIVIDKMLSSNWNATKVTEFSNPQIPFVDGAALTQSQKPTKKSPYYIGINVLEHQVHQVVDAFGGGITDSVAIELKTNHPKDYDDLLHLLFSPDEAWLQQGGVAVRVPLGACDFGITPYTYDDTADGSDDPNFELFSINKAPKMWATLKDILPDLKIFSAPWSAPGWMKTGGDDDQPLFGGSLKTGYEEVFAKYLIRSVVDIKKLHNINIFALSLLNEPLIPRLGYPTMKMTSDQAIKVVAIVRKGLNDAGLSNTKLVAWDFNWDTTDYALQVLDADPTPWDGVAWHGYAGNATGQGVVSSAYPDKEVYFTEFTQITQYLNEPYKNMKNTASSLIVGSIRYGARSIVLWNLNEDGMTSPHLDGVCDNCLASVFVLPEAADDPSTSTAGSTTSVAKAGTDTSGDANKSNRRRRRAVAVDQPKRRLSEVTLDPTTNAVAPKDLKDVKTTGTQKVYTSDLFKRSSDFSVLKHLSTAVRPIEQSTQFSKRIGVTSTDETSEFGGNMLVQAFRQDGVKPGITRFSLVVVNQNDHYESGLFEDVTAVISFRGQIAKVITPPGLYTISWEAPTNPTSGSSGKGSTGTGSTTGGSGSAGGKGTGTGAGTSGTGTGTEGAADAKPKST
ncbi:LOW QUALITY PROTEIN: glycoside hydrolase [Testicularia cyperi]|uniref:Glycoside hydrolase n=1 Tax=Testicularia cyperi TaxID=1882483 RepID=A0A317XND9_9BASI|nr:LOW QUALITY PROTEIN: glycoside hydrolase [Testicularia cyperi]